jgi:myo-inositol 2-dehydrogenase/D-chiro-inositol 1-dehydrogenase
VQMRIGLIGAGRIGKVHAESVAGLPNAQLVLTADVFVDGAKDIAAQYGGMFTDNPEEVFDAEKVDLIIVASPTGTHIDLIDSAIDSKIPILCEKPIDLDIARVEALAKKARASNSPIMIAFNRRFDPSYSEVHRRTASGEIGDLEQLSIVSRDPSPASNEYLRVSGGIFRDMTIHDFDMARNFVPEISKVTARGFNHFSKEIAEMQDFDAVSRHSAFGFDQRLEAFGSKGMLAAENRTETTVRHYSGDFTEQRPRFMNFFLERYMESYRNELSEFIRAIEGEEVSYPTFEDGRKALLLANAAIESAQTGQTISLQY